MKLEYLIIYKNTGTPIYANCFADLCKTVIKDPMLFSAFLASLNQFAYVDPENLPNQMDLDGLPLSINLDFHSGIKTVKLEELELIFHYSEIGEITIAAGFNSVKYNREQTIPIFDEFLLQVNDFMGNYQTVNWNNVATSFLLDYETELMNNVIHPFFEQHDIINSCSAGENCPFRIAIFEEKGTIFERLKNKIEEYREYNILQKIKVKITKSKFPFQFNQNDTRNSNKIYS